MEYQNEPNAVTSTVAKSRYLFEVTWFSKLVTLILLLTLPVVGFLLGLKYNLDNAVVSPYPTYQDKQVNENLVRMPPVERAVDVEEDFDFQTARVNIEAIITTEATDASQCKTIAFGDRACGGPEEFLIYSTLNTDVELLENLVSEYNYQAGQYNLRTGLASICSIEMEPEVTLKNGVCVEKPYEFKEEPYKFNY